MFVINYVNVMDKFQNKYRITSARLQSWDYGANGVYFISICTKNRMHYFGEITETLESSVYKMQLNEIGQLAEKYWMQIPHHFPFVKLGAFAVMPNHTHGILIIDSPVGAHPWVTHRPGNSCHTRTFGKKERFDCQFFVKLN